MAGGVCRVRKGPRAPHARGDGLGEDDADRVADLHRLLVAGSLEVQPVDRGHGELDRQADRVVGERHTLCALHLLGELAQPALELLGIAKRIERLFHPNRS